MAPNPSNQLRGFEDNLAMFTFQPDSTRLPLKCARRCIKIEVVIKDGRKAAPA